jgi:hypothetical protein
MANFYKNQGFVLGTTLTTILTINTSSVGILVSSRSITINKLHEEELNPQGHATCFFKLMGRWVYYDDNRGFNVVDEKVIEALKEGILRIVIYKSVYFVKKIADVYDSVWENGKWDKSAAAIFYDGAKLKTGIILYRPIQFYSIIHAPELLESSPECNISEKEYAVKTVDELNLVLGKFRNCIYSNLRTNSKIFEYMYKFLYENIELVKKNTEVLAFVEKSIKTVVLRPACSPFTHYWCSKIKLALSGKKANSLSWFKLPKLTRLAHNRVKVRTPRPHKKKLDDGKSVAKSENESNSKTLTPCLPGQVRNMKTLKCKERAQRKPKERGSIKSADVEERKPKEKCPKGEMRDTKTGRCLPKPEPCPAGQVRDKETGNCRGRLDKNKCPEGQIFDKKTKKCRDPKGFKF